MSPAIISLCLTSDGQAAIVYTSPLGKRTEVARYAGQFGASVPQVAQFIDDLEDAWTGAAMGPRDVVWPSEWACMITDRQLAKIIVKGEPK